MSGQVRQKPRRGRANFGMFLFPAVVLLTYGVLLIVSPGRAMDAIRNSGHVALNMFIPLALIFVLMVLINLLLKPARVARLLGKSSGVKGIALSAAAGIISTGPIYTWYPLLKDLKEKGAGDSPIAIFLYNRAVKPFLLPIMVAYFGWLYVLVLTILTVGASVFLGYSINLFLHREGN